MKPFLDGLHHGHLTHQLLKTGVQFSTQLIEEQGVVGFFQIFDSFQIVVRS
jgi:hypothetical protein